MTISSYLAVIINGICIGGLYGLMATAWSFQVGALKFANFAYGASIMASMYLTYFMVSEWRFPILAAIGLILLLNILFGYFMRRTVLREKNLIKMILTTMSITLIIINLVTFVFSAYPRDLNIFEKRIYLYEDISVGSIQLICLFMSMVFLFAFQLFLKKTWTGKAIRAVVQNPEAATLMGIRSERVLDIAFSLSYALIGVAALMLITMFQVDPNYGTKIQTYSFLVCVSAGLGSLSGAFFSGIIVGVVSALISFVFPSALHDPILFTLFVIILLVRPYGIFINPKSVGKAI